MRFVIGLLIACLIVIMGLVGVAIIDALGGFTLTVSRISPEATASTPPIPREIQPMPTTKPSTMPESKPAPESIQTMTFEPIVITGSGGKTSPPFTVTTSEWIIDWSYLADDPEWATFSFFVYPRGETMVYTESILFTENNSGSTYSYAGAGEYYIVVHAGNIQSWRITIRPA